MTDHTKRAEIEAQIAALQAELAAMDVDPWAAAVERYMEAADVPYANPVAVKTGLIAALEAQSARIAALEADLAKARCHINRTLQDHGRMLWRDDIEAHCPSFDLCSEYADNGLRCSPCAIKQSEAAGVEPLNLGKPYSPEEWRLKRQIDAHEVTIRRLMSDLQAHKDALAQSEPKR